MPVLCSSQCENPYESSDFKFVPVFRAQHGSSSPLVLILLQILQYCQAYNWFVAEVALAFGAERIRILLRFPEK